MDEQEKEFFRKLENADVEIQYGAFLPNTQHPARVRTRIVVKTQWEDVDDV